MARLGEMKSMKPRSGADSRLAWRTCLFVAFGLPAMVRAGSYYAEGWNQSIYGAGSQVVGVALDSSGNVYGIGAGMAVKRGSGGNLIWSRTYLGGASIAADGSGNVYVAGSVSGGSDLDLKVIKADSSGNVTWSRTFDSGVEDKGLAVAVDADGNVYAMGISNPWPGPYDFRVRKYSSSGGLEWDVIFDNGWLCTGACGGPDLKSGIALDSSGNVYAIGHDGDFRVFKITSTGTASAFGVYSSAGDPDTDWARDVALDGAGNVFVAGATGTMSANQFKVAEFDPAGTVVWSHSAPGYDVYQYFCGVAAIGNGNVAAVGVGKWPWENTLKTVIFNVSTGVTTSFTFAGGAAYGRDVAMDSAGNVYSAGLGTMTMGGYQDIQVIKYQRTVRPPAIPVPSGPTSGNAGTPGTYSATTTEPDGEMVGFGWDWDGDSAVDEWSGWVVPSTGDSRSHSWTYGATYNVHVKARNQSGGESAWSSAYRVAIAGPPAIPAMVAYPNPVSGDQVTIGVPLTDDAQTLTVEVFNLALQRVFTGTWENVMMASGTVTVNGLSQWAPGRYLVKATARLLGGETKKFATLKLVVKR